MRADIEQLPEGFVQLQNVWSVVLLRPHGYYITRVTLYRLWWYVSVGYLYLQRCNVTREVVVFPAERVLLVIIRLNSKTKCSETLVSGVYLPGVLN